MFLCSILFLGCDFLWFGLFRATRKRWARERNSSWELLVHWVCLWCHRCQLWFVIRRWWALYISFLVSLQTIWLLANWYMIKKWQVICVSNFLWLLQVCCFHSCAFVYDSFSCFIIQWILMGLVSLNMENHGLNP